MHIYNITFAVDSAVEDELLDWLRHEFIPAALTDDCEYFNSPEILRVCREQEPGTSSFALHLRTDSVGDIDRWYADHGSRLFAAALARWGERMAMFPTTLEVLQ